MIEISPILSKSHALAGFKSYLERTILGPFAPFSCVIGPNGCGKSVLVSLGTPQGTTHVLMRLQMPESALQGDAIAFVLGEDGSRSSTTALQGCIHDSLRSNSSTAPAAKVSMLGSLLLKYLIANCDRWS